LNHDARSRPTSRIAAGFDADPAVSFGNLAMFAIGDRQAKHKRIRY